MNSARKTVAAMLAALMVVATVPTVCASAEDLLSPQSGTIGTPKNRSTAEFVTETGVDRLVSVKPIQRRSPSSISLPDLTDGTVQRSIVARRFAPFVPTESVERAPIRGRAPPV